MALLEVPGIQVSLFEKSPSVGGRVATRRYGETYVNHGTEVFYGAMRVRLEDPVAAEMASHFAFDGPATALPKAMRRRLEEHAPRFQAFFNRRVARVALEGILETPERQEAFDHVLLTCPLPQARELCGGELLPPVTYTKQIILIGTVEGVPVRLPLPEDWSERHFDRADQELREMAQDVVGHPTAGLDVKKWRYARVRQGVPTFFYSLSPRITLAGDGFDPLVAHDAGAAWLSGMKAAEFIIRVLG